LAFEAGAELAHLREQNGGGFRAASRVICGSACGIGLVLVLAERRQRMGYEKELTAAVAACQ